MIITPQLEKIFLTYLRANPHHAQKVMVYFFKKSPEVSLLFKVFKNYIEDTSYRSMPSNRQLVDMAKLEDGEDRYSKETLELALDCDLTDYDTEEFIIPKFKAWLTSNSFKKDLVDIIELSRKMSDLDPESVDEILATSRELITKSSLLSFDDNDLGADFDDPDAHFQDNTKKFVKTGWPQLDLQLGGGWRTKSLNVLTAAPGVGKSMFLANAACNVADKGRNVAYATFELAKEEVIKRMACKRLKIPTIHYDDISRTPRIIRDRIASHRASREGGDNTFSPSDDNGKILVKEWPTGTCTILELDNWIKQIQERKGRKIDLLCVDYIQIMLASLGKEGSNNLYLKGKHLAEGLRSIAMKYDLAVLTATQIDKDMYGANDAFLEDIPESKAIAETADFVYGIICTEQMKAKKLYRMKGLKFRSTEFSNKQVMFDFNTQYLSIENDRMFEPS